MDRSALDKIETEGDLALGMGIAIGLFIALFAAVIALFVIEQGKSNPAPRPHVARDATAVSLPVEAAAATQSTRLSQ
jgi:hypothetical protein